MKIIRVDQVKSIDAANIAETTELLVATLIGGQAQGDTKPGVRQLKAKSVLCTVRFRTSNKPQSRMQTSPLPGASSISTSP